MKQRLRVRLRRIKGGRWEAHCLDMDIIGEGRGKKDALDSLLQLILAHMGFAYSNKNFKGIFDIE